MLASTLTALCHCHYVANVASVEGAKRPSVHTRFQDSFERANGTLHFCILVYVNALSAFTH